jgi:twinkle protein
MSESNFLRKESCPKCGSKDNLARYDDGHATCFTNDCNHWEPPTDGVQKSPVKKKSKGALTDPIEGEFRALRARKLREDTCKKYGYKIVQYQGDMAHACDVRLADGTLVAQKIRTRDKDFRLVGSIEDKPLIGMHLFSGGRRIIICEGEIDMLTYSQVQSNKFPVVSLPNGVKSAEKVIAANLDYLSNFDEVCLCFDMDEVGQEALSVCADLLIGHNVKLIQLPLKDPNEMLLEGRVEELVNAMWTAKEHKPDGLLAVEDIIEDALKPVEAGLPWMWDGLNASSNGRHYGEIVLVGAGTGLGKTDTLLQQANYDLTVLGKKVGFFLLENDPIEVLQYLAGKNDHRKYYEPNHPDQNDTEAMRKSFQRYVGNCFIYDNFGLCEWDRIKAKILYLIHMGYRIFYVDHLTALATGNPDLSEKDALEYIMADIAEFAKRYSVIFHLVSHLSTPAKGSHEEGAIPQIREFKGSRATGFWAHQIIALARNQQAATETERHTTIVVQLKRRKFGRGVGKRTYLMYDAETGVSNEITDPSNESGPSFGGDDNTGF